MKCRVKVYCSVHYRKAELLTGGRPRGFDTEAAVVTAMELFWERGYQGTSIAALTDSMGISPPSLYNAFGSKPLLFCEAADRYQRVEGAGPEIAMQAAPTARAAVEQLLRVNASLFTRPGMPRGCLLTRAVLTSLPEDEEVQRYLRRVTRERLRTLEARLARAQAAGEPLPFGDIPTAAGFYDAMIQGFAVRAQEGASRRELARLVDAAMAAWDALLELTPGHPALP